MKSRSIKSVLSATLLASLLAGCSSESGVSNSEVEQLKKEVAELKAENERLKEENAGAGQKGDGAVKADEPETSTDTPSSGKDGEKPATESTPLVLEANKPLVIDDFAEFKVTETKFAKKITPSNPGTFYTLYESKEADMTYLALTLKVKSLLESGRSASDFADVIFKYDSKYEYRAFSTIERSGGEDFTYTNITNIDPLKTGTLVFLYEVPKEIEKDQKPLVALLTIDGKQYEYNLR